MGLLIEIYMSFDIGYETKEVQVYLKNTFYVLSDVC